MKKLEEIRDYGSGWHVYIPGDDVGLEDIQFCFRCGVDLEKECMDRLRKKYPETYGRLT